MQSHRLHPHFLVAPVRVAGVLAACWMVACICCAAPPSYRYGESWWREYTTDGDTDLLLHFGPPTRSKRERLVEAVEKRREQQTLELDMDALDEQDATLGMPNLRPEDMARPPVDETRAGPKEVFDYSDKRREIALPEGVDKTDAGRFGGAIEFDGTGQLPVSADGIAAVECSFRVEAYPEQTACLFSVGVDETRLLLHPDGRLELKLRKPHGVPSREQMTEAQIELIKQKDATISSPDPVAVNEWVHVAVWNKPHPTPGGGAPWDARLTVNGDNVDWYLSERYNQYNWLGRRETEVVFGNSAAGDQGFRGAMDEVRVSTRPRVWYERPPMAWRDADLTRELQFGEPFLRSDAEVFHAPLDLGREYALNKGGAEGILVDLRGESTKGFEVDGIRGRGWVLDPALPFPRFSLDGMTAVNGSLEFWMRPVNWDDVTGYWQHTPPPNLNLSVARFFGEDKRTGKVVQFLEVHLPRAHNNERSRIPLDAGSWAHFAVVWRQGANRASVFHNGEGLRSARLVPAADRAHIQPLYVQFGIPDKVTVKWRERPLIEVDEVVGYDRPLAQDEVEQIHRRWKGPVGPIPLYNDSVHYKYSIRKLEYTLIPRIGPGSDPAQATVALKDREGGQTVRGPVTLDIKDGTFFTLINDGQEFPYGEYRINFSIRNADGGEILKGHTDWDFEREPWRDYDGGEMTEAPAPWTPVTASKSEIGTRMTTYTLDPAGLPAEIHADGTNILASPVRFEENGTPLTGELRAMGKSRNDHVEWQSVFAGDTCELRMSCRAEFDGMIRYELDIEPKKTLHPIRMVIPIKRSHASHYLYYPLGARGVSTGRIKPDDETVLESRCPKVPWREFKKAKRGNPKLKWADWAREYRENRRAYGFFGHVDINDLNRGLFWFADNAAGWWQSKSVSAVEIVQDADAVSLVLNLVAEPVDYASEDSIVFAILPHPARPMPDAYRLYDRRGSDEHPKAVSVFDAFRPWPMNPRSGSMTLFPASDPRNPDAGPSWEYAESCIPSMKATKSEGYRTLYLSKKWFSCRAGKYDGWQWRTSDSGAVSLTKSFVDYLCWEMNEWIGRDIWDAVYLDECYEEKPRGLEAGFSVRLPDGSLQHSVDNFRFRELMKRWYGLFVKHARTPMLLSHNTHSFQYQGLLYVQAYLDGENSPIVSLTSRDWIDSTSKHRFEVLQNGRLWGLSPFYMPYISEAGFGGGQDQYPVWQWRMARQAQSQFAHYEVATVYEGQGAGVYRTYWENVLDWGAGDPDEATFHPYWENGEFVDVNYRKLPEAGRKEAAGAADPWRSGHTDDVLVSFYKRDGKLLLIASNRLKHATEVRIELDRDTLRLPDTLTVRNLDGSFEEPEGRDFVSGGDAEKEAAAKMNDASMNLGAPDDDLLGMSTDELLLGEEGLEEREKKRMVPRVRQNTVILPIRPRDFRMVAVE